MAFHPALCWCWGCAQYHPAPYGALQTLLCGGRACFLMRRCGIWHVWEPDPADASRVSHGFAWFYMVLLYFGDIGRNCPVDCQWVSGGGAISVPIQMVREPLLGHPPCPLGRQCCLDMSEWLGASPKTIWIGDGGYVRPSGKNWYCADLCRGSSKKWAIVSTLFVNLGVCKNPAPIRLVFHDPPWAIFSFHSKKRQEEKETITLNVGSVNDLCPDSWNPMFFICPSFCSYLYSGFGFFISLFVVVMARQRMRVRFCTRKVPGRWSLHSFFDDSSHFQKEGTYTGFTNDNKTITKTITFGIKNGPCETRPFFFLVLSLSSPFSFPFLFLLLSFFLSLPFPSPFLFPFLFLSFFFSFSFPFSFPFLFLLLSFFLSFFFPFSFPSPFLCPFLFLSFFFSYSFSFPFVFFSSFFFLSLSYSFFSLPLLFLFLFPFRSCESFGQGVKPALGKTIRRKQR